MTPEQLTEENELLRSKRREQELLIAALRQENESRRRQLEQRLEVLRQENESLRRQLNLMAQAVLLDPLRPILP